MANKTTGESRKGGFVRGIFSTFFDLPRWIGIKRYVKVNKTLYADIKNAVRIAKPQREETFDEAMKRLNLTDEDLGQLVKANHRGLMILLSFIAVLCLYGVYLLFHGFLAATLLLLAVLVMSAVRAFQYSFWNFQIKHRQLGMKFGDWWGRK